MTTDGAPLRERGRPAAGEQVETPHGPWAAILPLLVGFFVVLAGASVVSVATSAIAVDLDAGAGAALWVTSAYLVPLASFLLVSGRLGDRYGPRSVYLLGLAVVTGGSLLAGLSDAIGPLIGARAVQGVGASLMTPQPLTVIVRVFPGDRRAAALGVWGVVSGAALVAGPVLGGALVQLAGWPAIFLVNVPVGVLTMALVGWLVPAMPGPRPRLDVVGTALSSGAVLALAVGLQQGPQVGWGRLVGWVTAPMVVGAGAGLMLAFVAWQRVRADRDPLVPLDLFHDRAFTLSTVAVLAAGFVATAIPLPILIWAQDARGLSPLGSALLVAPLAVAQLVGSPLVGRTVGRLGTRLVATTGFVGVVTALAAVAATIVTGASTAWLACANTLLGAASACLWGPLAVSATARVAADRAGAASGVYNTVRQLGGVLGVAATSVGMQLTIAAYLPGRTSGTGTVALGPLAPELVAAFGDAMGTTLLIPIALGAVGAVAAASLPPPSRPVPRPDRPSPTDPTHEKETTR